MNSHIRLTGSGPRKFLALLSAIALCASATQGATQPADRSLEESTLSLASLAREYGKADAPRRAALEELMLDVAQERRQSLAELVDHDASRALSLTIPRAIRSSMPETVKALVEERRTLAGALTVGYEDSYRESRLYHMLETDNGAFELVFGKVRPDLTTGAVISVSGVALGNKLVVDAEPQILATGGELTVQQSTVGATPTPISGSIGYQSTLVVLVNFQDQPGLRPWSVAEVQTAFFDDLNRYIVENSDGRAWVGGDVVGWLTIDVDSTNCNVIDIESSARTAAKNAGADPAAYHHLVYVWPQTSACAFSGSATVGGDPSYMYINGDLGLSVIGHEFGHTLGLYHGHSWSCKGETLGDTCQHLEYGDGLDIMGWSDAAHFSAFNKERLGWLNTTDTAPIEIASTSGTYELDPYANASGSGLPKAIKIRKGLDSVYGADAWYYLEYRQATGFDSIIVSDLMDAGNVLMGPILRTAVPSVNGNSGYLLDLTPETYHLYTRDPALTVQRSYTDEVAGVTVTTLWADGSSAGVAIDLAEPTCATTDPTLVLSPTESPWVTAGTAATFSVSVTNNSTVACPDASFDLYGIVPSGWTAEFEDTPLVLPPGSEGTTTLTIQSAQTATDGFYDITVSAVDSAMSGSESLTFIIDNGSANTAPHAVDDAVTVNSSQPVTIDVLANDWDAENDALVVEHASSGRKGDVRVNGDGTLEYTPGASFKGRDKFTYTISDGQASSTAAVTISKTQGR